jgi:PmbA protein
VTRLAEIAERALAVAGGEADELQASVVRERSLLSRFARSAPTQATAVDDTTVSLLALVDGHRGSAVTNDLSTEGLRDTALRAVAAARASRVAAKQPGEYAGLPGPSTFSGHDGFDLATAEPSPELAGTALDDAIEVCAASGSEAFGIWTAGRVTTAIANSNGLLAADDVTDAYMKVIARDPVTARSGWGACAGVGVGALDARAAAQRAAASVTPDPPRDVEPGEYEVVLAPDAVGTLLDFLGYVAFNGLAHAEGRGALVDRLGTRVAAAQIELRDDPFASGTLPRAFDAEGTPKAALSLISSGVAQGVVHDIATAARAQTTSTGHALAPGGSPYGPMPTNLVLGGGTAADETELIAGVKRGLYVTRLWYVNVVHERSALLTGMTRDGSFWIEDGAIAGPARDVRFTDSPLRLLVATRALTRERSLVSEADYYGTRFASGAVCPALLADGFAVTGSTPA